MDCFPFGMIRVEAGYERKEGGTITTTSSVFTKVFIRKDDRWYLANMPGTAVAK
ncbi:MAG TPA: hypothetical protein VFQ73_07845 [Flavisolibacter sp.]|nr:hypothetical protein [Flavisolibacter sp.]